MLPWPWQEIPWVTLPHPPFCLSQKKYLPHFIRCGPEGSIGTANGSGWMQEQDFVFLQHFVQYTRATEDNKVLLLLDNHSSHLSIEAVNFCRARGILEQQSPSMTCQRWSTKSCSWQCHLRMSRRDFTALGSGRTTRTSSVKSTFSQRQ